ncbi:phosphoglycerate kinase [Candidatus Saccharibacteria bacterium]|nr:phosphoglycerate kinase [Candidatus Saccharibacteria bacterium]
MTKGDSVIMIRGDYNVPLLEGRIIDDYRLVRGLDTIKQALKRTNRLILASHLGRPKSIDDKQYSLMPVAKGLSRLLGREVVLLNQFELDLDMKAEDIWAQGSIVMLENLRFDPREKANDPAYITEILRSIGLNNQDLGSLIYINDAFAVAHRADSSVEAGIRKFELERGELMTAEISEIQKLLGEVERPYVAVIGGAKVSDKLQVLESLLTKVDTLIIGGAMANTFLLASGHQVGNSLVEPELCSEAIRISQRANDLGVKLFLPFDVVTAKQIGPNIQHTNKGIYSVNSQDIILDIGKQSVQAWTKIISEAHTIFWNGDLGMAEIRAYSKASEQIAQAIANSEAYSLVGGGDTVSLVRKLRLDSQFSFISTGGGASLALVSGQPMPGLVK